MSRNIKEIGKELMGKSLNSFHRKTGLTQLEKNNEMQDGILDGILSQVDDAYIEKTEQSNVIHLDGSGDGAVVLDSIEGNTMVNLFDDSNVTTEIFTIQGCKFNLKTMMNNYGRIYIPLEKLHLFKSNGKYKVIVNITKNTLTESEGTQRQRAFEMFTYNYAHNAIEHSTNGNYSTTYDYGEIGIKECIITMKDFDNPSNPFNRTMEFSSSFYADSGELEGYIIISEYNENIIYPTQPFKGLQSSFEEKVNNEGKYEIEILMKGSNQFDYTKKPSSVSPNGGGYANYDDQLIYFDRTKDYWFEYETSTQKDVIVYFQCYDINKKPIYINRNVGTPNKSVVNYSNTQVFHRDTAYVSLKFRDTSATTAEYLNTMITKCHFGIDTPNDRGIKKPKQNKIKLLINEPLRSVGGIKDKLYAKDGKLVVERNIGYKVISQRLGVHFRENSANTYLNFCKATDILPNCKGKVLLSDKYKDNKGNWMLDEEGLALQGDDSDLNIRVLKSKIDLAEGGSYEVRFDNYIKANPYKVLYHLNVPTYEEVLNEYGEPIILEGYENGTIYIDSTIVPTTSVRYTPKMESFKTLNEVSNNNTMLANDINDNIIPYMMDVDFMIMEKEMALMSHKNIRKMEVLDMTSMQKRTQDMLERLIKGKTLTEQECKTRITTYLNAGKITDAQAEELMLLIDEVYA